MAAAAGLTAAWGLLSGLTQYHFAYACLLVGLVLARVLARTPAPRQPWLPALAAVLAFAVGFLGDTVAVAVALWAHYDIPAGTIVDHFGELFDNVARSHSAMDWVFFLLAAIAAAGLTAGRQITGADPFTRATPPTATATRDDDADDR
ncbi:MAG: hypothetical protein HOV83_19135 [Catenulispora sp.]|nr:hypothetical protein [Catenulispora sp.]